MRVRHSVCRRSPEEKRRAARRVAVFGGGVYSGDSVDIIPGSEWRERCEAVLERAASVTVAADHTLNWGGTEYEYANRLLQGLACVRARQLDTEWIGVAVWDGRKGDGNGGTASTLDRWRADELEVEVIPLRNMVGSEATPEESVTVEDSPSFCSRYRRAAVCGRGRVQ